MDPPADGAVTGAIVDLSVANTEYAEIREVKLAATTLWRMARSDLEDVANTVPTTFSHDSVIQPICMMAELSRNASLGWTEVHRTLLSQGKNTVGANGTRIRA